MERYQTPQNNEEQTLIYKYTEEKANRMMFMPPTNGAVENAPVYFIIPGGGWHEGAPENMVGFSRMSLDYAREHGWAVASIEYRLTENHVNMYQIISDCMDAARYLAHFKDVLRVDPNRIVLSGHSAGGQLALMMALAPHEKFTCESPFEEDYTAIGVCPLSPPTILHISDEYPAALKFSMYDLFPNMTTEELRDTSPIMYVSKESVPCLTVAGDSDDLVYPINSTLLIEKYKACGADGEVVYSHRGGHCFESMVEGAVSEPDFAEVQRILMRFLDRFND